MSVKRIFKILENNIIIRNIFKIYMKKIIHLIIYKYYFTYMIVFKLLYKKNKFINLFLFIILLSSIFINSNCDNEITITIRGTGMQKILGNTFYTGIPENWPNEILFNGVETIENIENYIFISEEANDINNIILKWDHQLVYCGCMFNEIPNITFVDFSSFDSSRLGDVQYMFTDCKSLTSIIFENFQTSLAWDTSGMFAYCRSLVSLDLSNFNTSIMYSMKNMFTGCAKLIFLKIDSFDTSKVTNMREMFYGCESLTSLDIRNFNTSLVDDMEHMFDYCLLLSSLNLSNFDTSSVTNMNYMFKNCKNLNFLNVDNFNVEKVEGMTQMFFYCEKLSSINLSQFKTSSVVSMLGLFEGCLELGSLDLSNFVTSKVINMEAMFADCHNLKFLNLSRFTTSSVNSTKNMFCRCLNLEYLNIDNFNTTSVIDMEGMFLRCENLKYLDLSSFITSSVLNMKNMFKYCTSLESLNLKNFNVSSVLTMEGMFASCESLISLNLSCFGESSVINLESMFNHCASLVSLDLSNFVTKSAEIMNFTFFNCNSLEFIDLSNFNTTSAKNMEMMLCSCKSLKKLNINHFDLSKVKNDTMLFDKDNDIKFCIENKNEIYEFKGFLNPDNGYSCNDECFMESKFKKIYETKECLKECYNNSIYKYEYNNYCYKSCPKKTNINKTKSLFLCENLYCEKYNKYYNYEQNECIDFIPDMFYLNNTVERTIDKCDISCKNCTLESQKNNLCITCNTDSHYYPYLYDNLISDNFIKCQYIESKKCNPIEFFEGKCNINNTEDLDEIINTIKEGIKGGSLNYLIKEYIEDNNEELIMKVNDITFQISSSDIQNNKIQDSISIIKLGKSCENKLRENNNIDINDTFLIFKIDVKNEDFLIPLIEYEIFDYKSKKSLDLSICNSTRIDILTPVTHVEKDLFKHNISSEYYSDICYPYTTEKGTDISLKDRKNEFINNNISLCESNCDLNGYNSETKMSVCQCEIKLKIPLMNEINFDKKKLINKFKDINNIMNIQIIKCYKLLFSKDGVEKNIGNYILLSMYAINILLIIVFIIKGFKVLDNIINKITLYKLAKDNKKEKNLNINIKSRKSLNVQTDREKNNKINIKQNKDFNDVKHKNNKNIRKSKIYSKKIKINKNPIKKKRENNVNFINENLKEDSKLAIVKKNKKIISKDKLSYINYRITNSNIDDKKNIKENKIENNIMKYNDNELNGLLYEEAIKVDKRNYWQYYLSLIRQKQKLIFTFYTSNDYNSRYIKICLFFLGFSFNYIANALFFSDSTMHKIYEDSYTFIYQIVPILYSTIISGVINFIINFLSMTEKNIIALKNAKKDIKNVEMKTKKNIKIKIISFIALNVALMALFWYYISCFCAVYKNTQTILIKDTLSSFFLSLLYPIIINLIPGIFRIYSLSSKKKDKRFLYQISKILQLI